MSKRRTPANHSVLRLTPIGRARSPYSQVQRFQTQRLDFSRVPHRRAFHSDAAWRSARERNCNGLSGLDRFQGLQDRRCEWQQISTHERVPAGIFHLIGQGRTTMIESLQRGDAVAEEFLGRP